LLPIFDHIIPIGDLYIISPSNLHNEIEQIVIIALPIGNIIGEAIIPNPGLSS